jgi:thioredoxin reductase (NADPH)
MSNLVDVIVIGAGPTGLACAIDAQKAGLTVEIVEKGCLCNSLFHYPANMTFFTTPELLEIGDIPFPSPNQKPTRNEALQYYRQVAQHYKLVVHPYERVESVEGADGDFTLHTIDRYERPIVRRARKLVIASGYYDLPNYLGIPGESLAKVFHYYNDPHPYCGMEVLVIGGKNSAAIAALELWRNGARVTLVHRDSELHRHVKYWIKPDLENRIKNGEITAYFQSHVTLIEPDTVTLQTPRGELLLVNNFVFAMTGYHPDFDFLLNLGIKLADEDQRPQTNPKTLESNVAGIYLAGVIVAGSRTNEIFIENGRLHGQLIAASLKESLKAG